MSKRVVILGGGIAGLSAAHELVERGFEVEVYEKRDVFGGKARSVDVPDSAENGREPLPGEHGFRFFPAFYRHTFDTMKRIPYGDNDQGVFDNLVQTTQTLLARKGASEVTVPLNLPRLIEHWDEVFEHLVGSPLGIPPEEEKFFVDRLLTFMTTCEERREAEYDDISWWDFIEAERMSEEYKRFHAVGATRSLVAVRAEESSTKTAATILVQLLLGVASPWLHADSVLDGPTNDVWIDPWVQYLREQGVKFFPETPVRRLETDRGHISQVVVESEGEERTVSGDYYIAAVPVEVMRELVTDEITEHAPSLANLDQLKTAWMNGILFYLDCPAPITDGHVIYSGAPWALTSVAQGQFWDDEYELSQYGNGEVDGILSICISNWEREGNTVQKPARECTPEEIKEEVWAQMTARLNDQGEEVLDEDNIVDWFLDPSVEFPAPNETTNAEPLLINTVGSWDHRPEASTEVPNLYVAADYVRSHTDLATMEGANETARRAVNGILDDLNSDEDRCEVWPLKEPEVFEPMKAYDRLRFKMGLPHHNM